MLLIIRNKVYNDLCAKHNAFTPLFLIASCCLKHNSSKNGENIQKKKKKKRVRPFLVFNVALTFLRLTQIGNPTLTPIVSQHATKICVRSYNHECPRRELGSDQNQSQSREVLLYIAKAEDYVHSGCAVMEDMEKVGPSVSPSMSQITQMCQRRQPRKPQIKHMSSVISNISTSSP